MENTPKDNITVQGLKQKLEQKQTELAQLINSGKAKSPEAEQSLKILRKHWNS